MKVHQKLISLGNQSIKEVTLENNQGSSVKVLALGATLDSFIVLLKNGVSKELVVSPSTKSYYYQQFEHVPYYFGATIGRYAGRLSKSVIEIGEKTYLLDKEKTIQLHGGKHGLSKKIWEIKQTESEEVASVTLFCQSPHLEGGYPGNLQVEAKYTLRDDNSLEIIYTAISDRDTILNLTNHVYFNIGNGSVLHQSLQINSKRRLETDDNLIPTGKRIPLAETPYDFRSEKPIQGIAQIDGLDTTYCFDQVDMKTPKITYAAKDTELQMKVFSNQQSAVVFAPPKLMFKEGIHFQNFTENHYPSICFEMQNYPDAPNHPLFPNTLLRKGELYENRMVYKVESYA